MSKINGPVVVIAANVFDVDGKLLDLDTIATALNFHDKLVEALNVLNDAVDDTLAVVPTSVLKAATKAEALLADLEAAEEVGK